MRSGAFLLDIFLLLLVGLTGFLFWNTSSFQPLPPQAKLSYDAFAKDITSTQYDISGKKRYEFQAPDLQHYKRNNITIIQKPIFYMYNKQGQPWKITSDHANAMDGLKQIHLIDQVKISGEQTDSFKNMLLFSQQARYYPEEGVAVTYDPVTILQPGVTLHAIGMKVFFKENKVQLLSKVEGEYDPSISQQTSH